MKFKHTSVLLHDTIDNLKPKNDGLYVDATFGGGGHAKYLLSKIDTGTLLSLIHISEPTRPGNTSRMPSSA